MASGNGGWTSSHFSITPLSPPSDPFPSFPSLCSLIRYLGIDTGYVPPRRSNNCRGIHPRSSSMPAIRQQSIGQKCLLTRLLHAASLSSSPTARDEDGAGITPSVHPHLSLKNSEPPTLPVSVDNLSAGMFDGYELNAVLRLASVDRNQ